MIERLRLRQWRAFDAIDLALSAGTTFLVAPNGTGKTSLLLGAAWALYGDQAEVDPRSSIRAGASEADAELVLRLDDGRLVTIRRSVPERGRPRTDHDLDGTPIGNRELESLLQESFRADPRVAARLSMMVGGGHVASERALTVDDHLYQAFGVTDLRRAAEQAAAQARAASRQRREGRAAVKLSQEARQAKEAELTGIERALAAASEGRDDLAATLDAATRQREVAQAWSRYEADVERRRAALAEITAATRSLEREPALELELELEFDDDAERLAQVIDNAVAAARADLDAATDRLTDARARVQGAEQALALLQSDEPSCPTCLRSFHDSDLDSAVTAQQSLLDAATVADADWQATRHRADERLQQLVQLQARLAELPLAPDAPAQPQVEGDPEVTVSEALGRVREHDRLVGRLAGERDAIARVLAIDDDRQRAEQAQRAAYRNEAVTSATAAALADAADRLTESYIEPLSQQVRWRWKALFGEGGLQLKPDGSIVRVVGERELPWDSLSGGERIWARLITHLLVMATSTRLPFAWFDEPLEHLDPRARRGVAAALATATRTGGPGQLIVTTYEHAIARQLAADVPEASIRYLRGPVTDSGATMPTTA